MSSDTFYVQVRAIAGDTVELRCTTSSAGGANDLATTRSFALMAIEDGMPYTRSTPLQQALLAIADDMPLAELSFQRAHVGEFIASTELLERDNIIEDLAAWSQALADDSAPLHEFVLRVRMTDPRWLEGLAVGARWGTVAFDVWRPDPHAPSDAEIAAVTAKASRWPARSSEVATAVVEHPYLFDFEVRSIAGSTVELAFTTSTQRELNDLGVTRSFAWLALLAAAGGRREQPLHAALLALEGTTHSLREPDFHREHVGKFIESTELVERTGIIDDVDIDAWWAGRDAGPPGDALEREYPRHRFVLRVMMTSPHWLEGIEVGSRHGTDAYEVWRADPAHPSPASLAAVEARASRWVKPLAGA